MSQRDGSWPMRPIGELLKQVRRPVDVEPDTIYREIGIRSHCKGIFHKSEITGKRIGNKRVFWVEPGCLVLNIVFAWEQAVAMTSSAEAGMIASHRFPMYCTRNGKLLPEYVWRYFSTPRGKYDLNIASPGGAGRNKTLGQEEFKRLKFPVPPIEYQRKAVAILSTADRAIAGVEKLIAAKRTLKKGLAQQLLTGQRRLPGFNRPWKKTALLSFGKCIRGVTYKAPDDLLPDDSGATVRLLRAGNIAAGQVIHCDLQFVKAEKVQQSQILQEHDIAICMSSGSRALVGKAARYSPINGHRYTVGAFCSIFRPKHGAAMTLVPHLFDSEAYRRWICVLTAGSSINNLTGKDIEGFALPLPTESSEQDGIAFVLGAADREIALLEKKLTALRELKKGLMQKLLSGSDRVSTSGHDHLRDITKKA
jgi:type I restriction enzyme, S subunit